MAAFVAATVRKSSPRGSESYELTSFIARRPLTSAALISAKLKATVLSTLATWLLLLHASSLALWLSGSSPVVVDGAHRLAELVGTPRAVAIGLLGITVLVMATWKQLVQSLYIGLSGRPWLVKTSVFVALPLFAIVVPFVPWVVRNIAWALAALWNSLPWILAVLVCVKVCAAAAIAWRLRDRHLVSDSTLVIGALLWTCLGRRSLWAPGMAVADAPFPQLSPRARRDPHDPPGATLRRPAGALMEPASMKRSAPR